MSLGVINKEKKINKLVYTVWTCLKATTQYKTVKEEASQKKHNNDNYNYYSDTILLHFQFFEF